jgi:hypothetical protein
VRKRTAVGSYNIPILGENLKKFHMKSYIISCILSFFALYICQVSVAFLLNQTSSVCLITERKFYKFQSLAYFKIRDFVKVFKSKNQKKIEKKREKIRKGIKRPRGPNPSNDRRQPTAHFSPSPNRYPFFSPSHRHPDPTCHPSQANRLEHGAPERDLPGLLTNSV